MARLPSCVSDTHCGLKILHKIHQASSRFWMQREINKNKTSLPQCKPQQHIFLKSCTCTSHLHVNWAKKKLSKGNPAQRHAYVSGSLQQLAEWLAG